MLKKIYENKIPNTVFHLHSNNIKFLRLSSLANTPTTLFSWFSCEKLRLLPTAASRCMRARGIRAGGVIFRLFLHGRRGVRRVASKSGANKFVFLQIDVVSSERGGEQGLFAMQKVGQPMHSVWERKRAFHRLVGQRQRFMYSWCTANIYTTLRKRHSLQEISIRKWLLEKSMSAFCWRRDCPNYERRRPLSIQWILQNLSKQTSDPIDSSLRNVNKTRAGGVCVARSQVACTRPMWIFDVNSIAVQCASNFVDLLLFISFPASASECKGPGQCGFAKSRWVLEVSRGIGTKHKSRTHSNGTKAPLAKVINSILDL